jgi:hypothetical protein
MDDPSLIMWLNGSDNPANPCPGKSRRQDMQIVTSRIQFEKRGYAPHQAHLPSRYGGTPVVVYRPAVAELQEYHLRYLGDQ